MKNPVWTQAELARRVGIHPRDLHKYETGKAGMSVPMAFRIAGALGRTVDEMLYGERDDAAERLGARSRALAVAEPAATP